MKRTEKDCSSIELVVTEKGRERRVIAESVEQIGGAQKQRREEQTKQRVAEDVGRPEQRSAKKAEQRVPEKQSEEQSEADQEVRVAVIGIWKLKPWWEDCCFLRRVRTTHQATQWS